MGFLNIDFIQCDGGGNTDCLNQIYWLSDGSTYDTAMSNATLLTPSPYGIKIDDGGPCIFFEYLTNSDANTINDAISVNCGGAIEFMPACEFDCQKQGK